MEFIIIIIGLIFLYVFLDTREARKKEIDDINNQKSALDRYIDELDSGKRKHPESAFEDEHINEYPDPNKSEPDLYPGSNKWYEDKEKYISSSKKWRKKKFERQALDKDKCVSCGYKGLLECHHITYKNLFKEPMSDLRTLCRTCHEQVHRQYGMDYNGHFPVKSHKRT